MTLRTRIALRLVTVAACAVAASMVLPSLDGPGAAAQTTGSSSIQVLHVVPSGVTPRFPDMEARITSSLSAVQSFLLGDVGRTLRIDPGVTTVSVNDDTVAGFRTQLIAQGFNDPNTIYLSFIESAGLSNSACGLAIDRHAMLLMPACDIYPQNGEVWPFGASYLSLHELLHTLGAVRPCAPNYDGTGHSNDSNRDMLYMGGPGETRDWDNLTVDFGNDDYYGHDIPGCPDVEDSPFWFVPGAATGYTPLNPTRLYDSRVAFGPWAANETRSIQVRGLAGIPANATAVVVHVTSVTPTADTFITAWASGQPQPTAASKNLGPGTEHTQITNDLLIVPIGTDGRINIFNNLGTTHLVFDVVGYFSPTGDQYSTLNPTRLYDSRIAFGPWAPNETRSIQVRGLAGIPANATAVVVHVTSVTPTADTFITAWASGQPQPTAASKNLGPGTEHTQITNDLLIVPIGTDGRINIFNNLGTTHLVFDVVGYFSPTGDQYSTLNPTRLYDSRIAFGPWAPNETRSIQVRGLAGIPANATAVVVHVTSVTPTADTFITAWASGQPQPTAASKNLGPGNEHTQITNDLLIVPIGTDGRINIFNNLGTTHLVFDVVGYFG